jgi:hypothetical protein
MDVRTLLRQLVESIPSFQSEIGACVLRYITAIVLATIATALFAGGGLLIFAVFQAERPSPMFEMIGHTAGTVGAVVLGAVLMVSGILLGWWNQHRQSR